MANVSMSAKINKENNPDWLDKVMAKAVKLTEIEAAAGFPSGQKELNTPHYDNGASIIDVALWNNYGTYNSPARDFMTPSGKKAKERWNKIAPDLYNEVVNGKLDAVEALENAGQIGATEIKKAIVDLKTPANAPITVKGGWMHNKKSGKLFKVEGKKSNNPLVDTGAMANAATYVVRKKKK